MPTLLHLARRAANNRSNPELAMAPIGALTKLIATPDGLKAFSDLEGEALLLHLLKADSAQVRCEW